MERFVVALPLPAGAEDDVRAFVGEVEARMDELRGSRTRLGVTRETAWLQRTPMGDIFILDLEGDDPVGSNEGFAASSDPFDVWFKERAGAIFDANFNEPIPVRPEKLYRSTPDDSRAAQTVALVAPIVPGKEDAHRALADEVKGPRREAFDGFHDRAGVVEDWWLQETPMGTLALVYLESDDLMAAIAHLASSDDETEVWFKESLKDTQGIDWSDLANLPPLPEQLYDWRF